MCVSGVNAGLHLGCMRGMFSGWFRDVDWAMGTLGTVRTAGTVGTVNTIKHQHIMHI